MSELLTTAQAAQRLGVDRSHVRRLIATGKLKAVKLGPRVIVIDEAEVERYKAERKPAGRPRTQDKDDNEQ